MSLLNHVQYLNYRYIRICEKSATKFVEKERMFQNDSGLLKSHWKMVLPTRCVYFHCIRRRMKVLPPHEIKVFSRVMKFYSRQPLVEGRRRDETSTKETNKNRRKKRNIRNHCYDLSDFLIFVVQHINIRCINRQWYLFLISAFQRRKQQEGKGHNRHS